MQGEALGVEQRKRSDEAEGRGQGNMAAAEQDRSAVNKEF